MNSFIKTTADLVELFATLRRAIASGDFLLIEWKVQKETRTLAQNSKLWAMLTDISQQVTSGGRKFCQDDWKDILSASFRGEKLDMVPTRDGRRLVILGMSTRKMGIKEKAAFIEYIYSEFAGEVFWKDPKDPVNSEIPP